MINDFDIKIVKQNVSVDLDNLAMGSRGNEGVLFASFYIQDTPIYIKLYLEEDEQVSVEKIINWINSQASKHKTVLLKKYDGSWSYWLYDLIDSSFEFNKSLDERIKIKNLLISRNSHLNTSIEQFANRYIKKNSDISFKEVYLYTLENYVRDLCERSGVLDINL